MTKVTRIAPRIAERQMLDLIDAAMSRQAPAEQREFSARIFASLAKIAPRLELVRE